MTISEQDGPSLESSSYLNVTLKYLGPWGPLDLGIPGPGPLDSVTLGLWDLDLVVLVWFCMVWYRGVYFVPKLYNCPKAQEARDENFYNFPQFAR